MLTASTGAVATVDQDLINTIKTSRHQYLIEEPCILCCRVDQHDVQVTPVSCDPC